jgi:thiol-disulfide isomerase/thioredoxin
VSYTKFVEDEHVKLQFTPDSMGNFEMRIPVINSTRLYLYYFMQGDIVTLFAEPGEKIGIHSDWEKKTLAFSGEHAQSHQEVYDYGRYVDSLSLSRPNESYIDERISHEECLRLLTAEWTQNDSLLNAYRQKRPEMSNRAVAQVQAMNQNSFAFKLMQRRFMLDRRKKEAFSEEYMQKADSIYSRLTRPYTLSDVVFLRDHLDYYYEQQGGVSKNMKMLFDYLKANKGIVLTEEQQTNMDFLNTPEMDEALNDAYEVLINDPEYEAALIDRWCGGMELVPMADDLKELMYAFYHYFYLDGTRKAMHEQNMRRFLSLVKNQDIARPVVELQQKYVELEKQDMGETLSSLGYEHLKNCTTGEELFREILKPCEGKVVYLDVWGTWCGPCKKEMEYVSAIKQAMKGKEVVFLYLANGSPEVSWKNIIKEYSLTGEQVEHYNLPNKLQNILEKYLQIKHYPTYLLIDRNGEIVDREPPRPSSENQLVDYLNKCLEN